MSKVCKDEMVLVFEYKYGIVMVEPSDTQIYRTTRLDKYSHSMKKNRRDVDDYKIVLSLEGYVEVQNASDARKRTNKQARWFIFLSHDTNHFLDEISVFNIKPDDVEVHNILKKEVRLLEMSTYLFDRFGCNYYRKVQSVTSSKRGNYTVSCGFATQCITSKIDNMNAYTFCTNGTHKEVGFGSDENLTVSILSGGIGLTRVFRLLSQRHDLDYNDFEGCQERTRMFSHRVAKIDYNVPGWRDFIMEGLTYSITGQMKTGDNIILDRHTDSENARDESHSAYWNVSQYMLIEDGKNYLVRGSLGAYGKVGCDHFMKRRQKYNAIKTILVQWMRNPGNADRFIPLQDILKGAEWDSDGYCLRKPHSDKSVYYSIFIHGMFTLKKMFGYNLGIICEAVWLMGIVRCPDTWYRGILAAAKRVVDGRGKNLVIEFIEYVTLELYDKLSLGKGARRIPSYNKVYTNLSKIWESLRAIHSLIKMANECKDRKRRNPKTFMKQWIKKVDGAGQLIGSEQVHVLTMMNVITDTTYMYNIDVAMKTKTGKRVQKLGVHNGSDLIQYLSFSLSLQPWVVENMICESLKEEGADNKFCDVLVDGQCIYELKNGQLIAWNKSGVSYSVEQTREWKLMKSRSLKCVEWWQDDFTPCNSSDTISLTSNHFHGLLDDVKQKRKKRGSTTKRKRKRSTTTKMKSKG